MSSDLFAVLGIQNTEKYRTVWILAHQTSLLCHHRPMGFINASFKTTTQTPSPTIGSQMLAVMKDSRLPEGYKCIQFSKKKKRRTKNMFLFFTGSKKSHTFYHHFLYAFTCTSYFKLILCFIYLLISKKLQFLECLMWHARLFFGHFCSLWLCVSFWFCIHWI